MASEQLERAYAVLRVPSIGLWSARALARNGKLVEASERYLELARLELGEGDQKVQQRALEDAAQELAELSKRVPSITIAVEGAKANEVTLGLDGAALSSAIVNEARPVNPGRHVVTGSRGSEQVQTAMQVKEGDHAQTSLAFHAAVGAPVATRVESPKAVPETRPEPTLAGSSSWNAGKTTAVALGVLGVAGGIVAAIELSKFQARQSQADILCHKTCGEPSHSVAKSLLDESLRDRSLAIVAGAVGGACILAGGILWFASSDSGTTTNTSIRIMPSLSVREASLGITGSW
jgi:hypothetical protein